MIENGSKEMSREMSKIAIEALEDKKASDVRVIDISEVSVLADYFIIAGGSNRNQIQAMSDEVEKKLGQAGHEVRQIEGYETGAWVLLDFGDVIVHIFSPDRRRYYSIEDLYKESKVLLRVA